eukprot:363049-Chlamydomonas_euryale.AAC.13
MIRSKHAVWHAEAILIDRQWQKVHSAAQPLNHTMSLQAPPLRRIIPAIPPSHRPSPSLASPGA